MKDIIIVSAGGFGRELLQWIKDINAVAKKWNVKGFIDDNTGALNGYECDCKVLGKISEWQPADSEVFACAIAEPRVKERVVLMLKSKGAVFEQIIHPRTLFGEYCKMGEGVVVYPGGGMTVNARLGDYVTLLSTGLGHDVEVDEYTTISSNCGINGKVRIGKRVFIGSNAVIVPSRTIGDDAKIAAGSVVFTNVKPNKKVLGNPAKYFDF